MPARAFTVGLKRKFSIFTAYGRFKHLHVSQAVEVHIFSQQNTIFWVRLITADMSVGKLRQNDRGDAHIGADVHEIVLLIGSEAELLQLITIVIRHFGNHVVQSSSVIRLHAESALAKR